MRSLTLRKEKDLKNTKKICVFERPCRHARLIVYLYPGSDVLLNCLTLRMWVLPSVESSEQ